MRVSPPAVALDPELLNPNGTAKGTVPPMKTLTRQTHAVVAILEITHDLIKAGRIRKRPGKPRPEAMSFGPSPVPYTSPYATHYSLAGAIKKAAYSMRNEVAAGTLSRARREAATAVLDALSSYGAPNLTIEYADDHISDTRLILRAIKLAIKDQAR